MFLRRLPILAERMIQENGIFTTKPVQELDYLEFKEIIRDKNLVVSPHACDHLSTMQRKIFKEEELIQAVKREIPRRIYLQRNGRHAAYY